jgi:exonuclease SbcC
MKEENSKNYVLLSRYTNLKDSKQHLSELRDQVDELSVQLKAVNESLTEDEEFSEKLTDSYYAEKEQLDALEQATKNAGTKCHAYLSKCLSNGFEEAQLERLSYAELSPILPQSTELQQFLSLTENQINDKISKIEKEIETKKERIKTLKVIIEQYQREKEQLEKQKPHKYESSQAMLDGLYQRTQGISSKLLSEYDANLKSVRNKRVTKNDQLNDKKIKYYEEVSKYIASRIGVFRHIGTFYKASKVDLISEEIITEDGLTIHFVDMGTGESQSAYILGLLSSVKNDNRRIIALFDEIAMMDNASLKPVLAMMQRLYQENKLLIGIMAQKSEDLATRSPDWDKNGQ